MGEHFVTVDGHKARYLEYGTSDQTLVLIHGLGASAERWEFVAPLLSKHYRLIIPDLLGFGLSDKPAVDYTPDFFSEFLENFLKQINISNPFLIGSSLGGQVTAEFAARTSIPIQKLILVSPSGMMKHSTPALDAYVMAALYPNDEAAKNAFELMSASTEPVSEHIVSGFIERMHLPNAKMAFMSTLLGLKNADVISTKLEKISIPSMVIWGDKDPVIPVKYADEFVSSLKNCKYICMECSGHTPYVDNPSKFTEVALEFLES